VKNRRLLSQRRIRVSVRERAGSRTAVCSPSPIIAKRRKRAEYEGRRRAEEKVERDEEEAQRHLVILIGSGLELRSK
jgi:hypothetical protein